MAADNSAIDPIDPVGPLADEFLARHRRGEQPTVADYIARYPEYAERIKQLFPMLLTMEEAGADQSLGATVAPGTPLPEWTGAHLDRVGGYRLLREIGRGGMGIVYEAVQESLGRHVALKVLPLHAARGGSGLERFRQEAKAAARLHHTNIVPVFEVGQDGDAYFYAMQFIAGQPLDQVLDEVRKLRAASLGRPVPPGASVAHSLVTGVTQSPTPASRDREGAEESPPLPHGRGSPGLKTAAYYKSVARVGVQVAQALDYAHREGVIHRDVKPSNLLLDADGRVWVTDFGLAKTDNSALTQTGDVVGTIRYMAPERFNGWSDPRSDVYALGLTMYEMLALRPAFDAEEQGRLMQQVLHDEPPRLRKVEPHMPRDLETIIAKAIDKEPSRRYQTAADLGADLQRFLEDRPIQARRIGPLERGWRWGKRNPALAAATVLTFAALLTATVVSVLHAAAQAESAATEKRLSDDLKDALGKSQQLSAERDKALKETRGHAAHSAIHRAQSLMERGEVHEAMLWLARALELAPDDDADVQHYARTSLASLEADAPILQAMWTPQHAAPVATAAFSADGTLILTGSEAAEGGASEARLWDAMTGKPLTEPLPHEGNITLAAISPDGAALLTASSSQPGRSDIRIWDRATGRQMTTEPVGYTGALTALVCGPKGKTFFTLGNPKPEEPAEAWFWEVADGTAKSRPLAHAGPVTALAMSPKGDFVYTAWHGRSTSEGGLRQWDALTAESIDSKAVTGEVTALAIGSDKAVWAATETGLISPWRAQTAYFHAAFYDARGTVRGLTLSPANDFALVMSENIQTGRSEARLWDLFRGRGLGVALPNGATAGRSAFAPDGRHVLTWHPRKPVRVWDLDTDRRWLAAVPVPSPNGNLDRLDMQFSPDGSSLLTVMVASQASAARRWDVDTGTVRGQPLYVPRLIPMFAASPDGRTYLLAEPREANFWDVVTGKSIGSSLTYRLLPQKIAFNSTGKTAALADAQRVWLMDVPGGQAIGPTFPRPGTLTDLRFSPDDKALWLTTPTAVRCLDAASGRDASSRVAVRGRGFHSVLPDPTGQRLAVHDQMGVSLWDMATGLRADFSLPHMRGSGAMAFTPDGKSLLTADPSGFGVQLWDVALGKPTGLPIHCPSLSIGAVFRPDGRVLAIGSSPAFVGSPGVVRLVRMPQAAQGDPAELARRARALSGLELTAGGDVRTLDPAAWQAEPDAPAPALAWHLRRGLDRVEVTQWDAALWHLDRRLKEQPDDWLALALRARALANRYRFDEAAADFDRSFDKGPTETVYAWYLLATQASRLYDEPVSPLPGQQPPLVDWFLHRLLARNTRDTGGLLRRRAQVQAQANHWDKAVADAERAAQLLPADSDLLMNLGHAYVITKQPDRAAATFIKAAAASPQDPDVWLETARRLVRLEQWDKATEHFLHAIDLEPKNDAVGAGRATICLEIARTPEVYERAVKRRPNDAGLLTGRARYHVERGEWKEAAADFARVVELEDFEERYYEYAAVLLILGDEPAYHKWVARMVEKAGNTDNPDQAYVLARTCVLSAKSAIDRARVVSWAEKALAAMPEAGWRMHVLGLALYRKGDYAGAITRLEQSEKSDWVPLLNWLVLAMAHHQLGHEKESRDYLSRATDFMDKRPASQPFTTALLSTDAEEAVLLRREADELILGKKP